jgi:hypothetical protein
MGKVIKFCILFLALDFIMPSNAQINMRFDNDCLLANSLEFGRAIMETIGEKATRKLIERDEKVRIAVEIDSIGKVTKILRSDFHYIIKKDSIRLLSNIQLKRHFYICYMDGYDQKEIIIRELRNEFRRNQRHLVVLFFPGAFHETYLYYKGRATKVDYIIERLKENKRH